MAEMKARERRLSEMERIRQEYEKHEKYVARPLTTALKYSALGFLPVAAFVVLAWSEMTPVRWEIAVSLLAFSSAMCFGYSYVGHAYGAKIAKNIFVSIGLIVIVAWFCILFLYVAPRLR